jgi:hypothetical protein
VQAPVLALPDFTKTFAVETDASDLGMGSVLMQDGHPISYLSKAFCGRNKGLSTYEKECMAILLAVDKWKPYLQHQEFILKTDHKSLLFLIEQWATTKLQQKAMLKLIDLNFKIQYKQGHPNSAADALSRLSDGDNVVHAVSVVQSTWLQILQDGYLTDPEAQAKLTELSVKSQDINGFSLKNGVIRYKNRVWMGSHQLAQRHTLQALHSSALGGESGVNATYQRVKALFAWPKLKAFALNIFRLVRYVSRLNLSMSNYQDFFNHCKSLPLPETGSLPSAKWFAECNFSGTRQRSSLPSAKKITLGKAASLPSV